MSLNFLRGFFAVTSIFALACAAAVYWLWIQAVNVPAQRPLTAWAPPLAEAAVAGGEILEPSGYPESFARPIFMPTRRPFVPPEEQEVLPPEVDAALMTLQQPAAPDASQLVLKGVRLNEGEQQALVLSATSSEAQWLSLGDEIDGFRLVAIGDDRVTLEAGQQKVEIKLYANNPHKLNLRQF